MAEAYLLNKSVHRTAAAALIRRINLSMYEGDLASFLREGVQIVRSFEGRTSGFVQSDLVAMLSAPFTGPKVKVQKNVVLFMFSVLFHSIKPKMRIKAMIQQKWCLRSSNLRLVSPFNFSPQSWQHPPPPPGSVVSVLADKNPWIRATHAEGISFAAV